MSNSVAIVVPSANGRGAAVATTTLAAEKTIVLGGDLDGVVIIEASCGGGYHPVAVFQSPGVKTLKIVCSSMRAFVQGYVSGNATCEVSADPDTPVFAQLTVPAADGVGAAVDISTLGEVMTIMYETGDNFAGALEVEIGSAAVLAQAFPSIVSRGSTTMELSATRARVRRRGFRADKAGTPSVWIGGAAPAGGISPVDLSVLEGELWYPPSTPNAEDDEFSTSPLSGWTRNYTVSATAIDPRAGFGAGDVRESLNSRRTSWLFLQPPADNTFYGIHKTFSGGGALPNGLYWARCSKYNRFNDFINNDVEIGMMFVASTAGAPNINDSIQVAIQELDTGDVNVQCATFEGGVPTITAEGGLLDNGNFAEYVACIKEGNNYYPFFGSGAGQWQFLQAVITYGGVATIDRLFLYVRNVDAGGDPGNGIFGFDFFRYTPNLILP